MSRSRRPKRRQRNDCTCWLCTPGALKRGKLRALDEQRDSGVAYRLARKGKMKCATW